MQMKKLGGVLATVGLASVLAACGGGGGGDITLPGPALAQSYGGALAATGTSSGINSVALKDSFDDRYLDAGVTKAAVAAALDQDAQAMAASAEYSGFPGTALSDVVVDKCNADGVCTLTGTLTNADADATSVPFSVQVINVGGTLRLYGDQKTT